MITLSNLGLSVRERVYVYMVSLVFGDINRQIALDSKMSQQFVVGSLLDLQSCASHSNHTVWLVFVDISTNTVSYG